MSFTAHIQHNTAILQPEGRFDAYQIPAFDDWLEANMSKSVMYAIVDLQAVTFIDTRALSVLVKWMKHTRQYGGDMLLCRLRQPVRVILELSSLDKAFQIHDSLETAQATITQSMPQVSDETSETTTVDNVHVIHLSQRVDAFTVDELKAQLDTLESDPIQNYVIDLADVTFMDSAGLAVLVRVLKHAKNNNGDVVLVKSNYEDANRILSLTKFDKVFAIHETVNDALAEF